MLFRDIFYIDEDFEVKRGDIAVADGKISEIGQGGTLAAEGFNEVINGASRLLIPGIVNLHSHVPMTLLRGYGEGLPLQRWLDERVFPFEDRMNAEDVYWGALIGIAEMLASGVTSFSDMYNFCGEICEAVKISGIKINISRGICEFGDSGLYGSTRQLESEALIRGWNGACNGRIVVENALHSEYLTNERVVREMANFAKSSGLGVHLHLSETLSEHLAGVTRRGMTPARYFEEAGIFDFRVTAAHCTHVTADDIQILARNGVTAVHCPSSNLKLGSGVAPVPEMLTAGVNVAIGTDGASSNNNLNMFEEMHLAGIIHRGVAMNPELTPASQIIRMATQNGATGQGRFNTGVIAVGNCADLAVLNLNKPHLTPVHDILSDIVFAAQAGDVEMTIVDGDVVYRNGEFLNFDIFGAMEKAAQSAHRIAAELN